MYNPVMAPAYTSVQTSHHALAPVPVAQPPQQSSAANNPQDWPLSVKEYVRRSFNPSNLVPGVTEEDMKIQLKKTITEAAEGNRLLSTDWGSYILPQQIIQQERMMQAQAHAHNLAYNQQANWYYNSANNSAAATGSPSSLGKKRSFDDTNEADSGLPPWRKTANTGSTSLEDRITYTSKSQAKKLKKAQAAIGASSKLSADVEKRRQRFDKDRSPKRSHHDEESTHSSGPVIGTSEDIFKGYFRLTRPPRAHEVRPQSVLQKTLRQLKEIWSAKGDYIYVCDQLKSIRQDLTVQHIKNSFTVEVYQTHALIALEKGDLGEYNQCQTQLRALYSLNLGGRPAEFLAYRILYFVHTTNRTGLNEILAELTATDKAKPEVKHALDVRSAVASGNYHRLFRLYLDSPNMGSYLMDMFVTRERLSALAKMCKSLVKQTLPISFIAEELGFESYAEAAQFIVDHGAEQYLKEVNETIMLDTSAHPIFQAAGDAARRKVDIKGQI